MIKALLWYVRNRLKQIQADYMDYRGQLERQKAIDEALKVEGLLQTMRQEMDRIGNEQWKRNKPVWEALSKLPQSEAARKGEKKLRAYQTKKAREKAQKATN